MERKEGIEKLRRLLGIACWNDLDTSTALRSITFAIMSEDEYLQKNLGFVKEDVEALINRLSKLVKNIDETVRDTEWK